MSLEAIPSTSDRVIFVWTKGQKVIYIVACFVDDTLWSRNQEFACIINQLNPFVPNTPFLYPLKTSENRNIFWCFLGIGKGCIGNKWVKRTFKTGTRSRINELAPSNLSHSALNNRDITISNFSQKKPLPKKNLSKIKLGCRNNSPPEISIYVFKISATITDIISMDKVIKFINNTRSLVRTPSFDLNSLEIH